MLQSVNHVVTSRTRTRRRSYADVVGNVSRLLEVHVAESSRQDSEAGYLFGCHSDVAWRNWFLFDGHQSESVIQDYNMVSDSIVYNELQLLNETKHKA